MNASDNLIEISDLAKFFPVKKGILNRTAYHVKAVDGVSFSIRHGKTLGLVGESGCGKTTTGRAILRLIEPTGGSIRFRSKKLAGPGQAFKTVDVRKVPPATLKSLRQDMQIIFQDPYSSLNPRMTVGGIVGEPLTVYGVASGSELEDRVEHLLSTVGLKPDHMGRYPHEFSGGQRQRIGIARALALDPQLVVADEPISALDVSIQAQVMKLLDRLQAEFNLTYLFISHDLSVVRYISNSVAVMYLGKIVEMADTKVLFSNPKHPYTEALISAVPIPDPKFKTRRIILRGDVPNPADPPSGCYFHTRCPYVDPLCSRETPAFKDLGDNHFAACHFADRLSLLAVDRMC
ncbi:MAG: ATP-binding cassette domain-containing protein [Desulfobacteraceae bacterium]|nr:ATP-binding cassette domain-containing protein [Desulfobacteraceae bacterium]